MASRWGCRKGCWRRSRAASTTSPSGFGGGFPWPFWADLIGARGLPSGELTFCHGKIHHAINGKIHYFDWAIFNSYVSLPEGIHLPKKRCVLGVIRKSMKISFWKPTIRGRCLPCLMIYDLPKEIMILLGVYDPTKRRWVGLGLGLKRVNFLKDRLMLGEVEADYNEVSRQKHGILWQGACILSFSK